MKYLLYIIYMTIELFDLIVYYDKLVHLYDHYYNLSTVSIRKDNDLINWLSVAPTFDVNVQEWESFIDSYKAMFHNNTILADITVYWNSIIIIVAN